MSKIKLRALILLIFFAFIMIGATLISIANNNTIDVAYFAFSSGFSLMGIIYIIIDWK